MKFKISFLEATYTTCACFYYSLLCHSKLNHFLNKRWLKKCFETNKFAYTYTCFWDSLLAYSALIKPRSHKPLRDNIAKNALFLHEQKGQIDTFLYRYGLKPWVFRAFMSALMFCVKLITRRHWHRESNANIILKSFNSVVFEIPSLRCISDATWLMFCLILAWVFNANKNNI